MWNVPGPQVRIPVYSVLVEHDDGLFLFDTGIDLDHMNRVLPFELPEQTRGADDPGAARAVRLRRSNDVTTLVNSHLHIDHVGGNQLFKGTGVRHLIHERELAQARNHEPFEFFGYSDKSWDYEGANIETFIGRRRAGAGHLALRDARSHRRPLLGAPRPASEPLLFAMDVAYTAAAMEKGIQPGFHNNPRDGVRSIAPREGSSPTSTARRSSSRTTWRRGRTYTHAPDYYERLGGHRWASWTTESRSSPAPRRGSARRSPTSSPTEGATVVGADIQERDDDHRPTSRKEDDVRRMVDDTVAAHGKLDVLVNVAAIVPFTAVGRDRLRRVAPDHVGQPRRDVPDEPLRAEGDARGGLRPHRQHRVERDPRRDAEPRPLRRVEGRRLRVHPRARPRARAVRDHRQLRRAGADGDRGRARRARTRRRSSSSRCCRRSRGAAVPADIAPAVAFLASEEAGWVTGQMLVADGGHTHN